MSAHYVYRLYDPKTGALLHEGTPTELVAKGLFPDRDRLQSEYMRQKKTVKKPRIWRIERESGPRRPQRRCCGRCGSTPPGMQRATGWRRARRQSWWSRVFSTAPRRRQTGPGRAAARRAALPG